MRIGLTNRGKALAGAAGLLLALVLILTLVVPALALPGVPALFGGTVTLNGAPAPEGTYISARIGGVEYGSDTGNASGEYSCQVDADDPVVLRDVPSQMA